MKGQEGGTDLPISRACITGRIHQGRPAERIILHPRDHGCYGADQEWTDLSTWQQQAEEALNNQGPLAPSLRWNAGAYLWMAGKASTLEAGLDAAERAMNEGQANAALQALMAWRTSVGR